MPHIKIIWCPPCLRITISRKNAYHPLDLDSCTKQGVRQLIDTTLLLTPNDKTSFYVNYDYGKEHHTEDRESVHWTGVAGAARFQVTPIFALAPRIEWFSEPDGAAIPWGKIPANVKPTVKEFTMTGEFKAKEGILMRLEYRRD